MRLAWRQLTRERVRFAVAVAGVAFAVVLMLMQLGFRRSLLRGSVRFHDRLQADLVLISPQSSYLVRMESFPRRRLDQARAFPGVVDAAPVYTTLGRWKNPQTGLTRTLFVVGIDPDRPTLAMADVQEQLAVLRHPDWALFDRRARREYGPIAQWLEERGEVEAEVNDRRTHVRGLFSLGTSFGLDGTLITSERTFLGLTGRPPGLLELGLLRLAPGVDPGAVQMALRAALESDVLVLTREEYAQREMAYWNTVTPVGYILGLGVLIGFGVGAIIVSQILFADVSDHLPEYATLKAMGFSDAYLFGVVLSEAALLAALGYLPGLAVAAVLYRRAAEATLLPMELTSRIGGGVFGLTVVMCSLAGVLALRKLRRADPAEIFG